MWQILVIACFFGTTIAGMDTVVEDTLKIAEECKQKTGAKEDIENLMNTLSLPSSPEGKCMVACVFQEIGLMQDENVDTKKVESFVMDSVPDLSPALAHIVHTTLVKCSKSGQSSDSCQNAVDVLACGRQAVIANMPLLTSMMGR